MCSCRGVLYRSVVVNVVNVIPDLAEIRNITVTAGDKCAVTTHIVLTDFLLPPP
jgi:hypothetical protein